MTIKSGRLIKILIVIIFVAGIAGYSFVNNSIDKVPMAEAAASDNITGFAWSENIGWISFNSNNCDTDNDGRSEGGSGCPVLDALISPYGVNVDMNSLSPTYQEFSGFAWSENIGWISFNKSVVGTPPRDPFDDGAQNYIAKINGFSPTQYFSGWARAISACQDSLWDGVKCTGSGAGNRSGGWDGWIKLKKDPSDAGVDYGVTLNGTDFEGWAWGGSVVGWISFNCINSGVCGTSNYKVRFQNVPPTISAFTFTPPLNFCDKPITYRFGWTFIDPGDTQSKYEFQVTTDPTFLNNALIKIDKIVIAPPAISNPMDLPILLTSVAGPENLEYDKTYYWRVMVWDSAGLPSPWYIYDANGDSLPDSFGTPAHEYPDVGFTPPAPSVFLVDTAIEFKPMGNPNPLNLPHYNSACYKAGNLLDDCDTWTWAFDGVSEPVINGAVGDITHSFATSGVHGIILTVEDKSGFTCSNPAGSKTLGSRQTRWVEVIPNN